MKTRVGLDRVRGDQAALDQPVRHAAITSRSLNAPGSDSSALTTRYFGFALLRSISDALRPIGKPAPPRPRRFAAWQLVDQVLGRHRARLLDARVAADRAVLVELRQVVLVGAREQRQLKQPARELLDDPGHVLGLHVLAVAVVDRDDGRVAAAAEALDARSVTSPSSVVSPGATPSSRSNASTTSCAPTRAHERFVQTSTTCLPTGSRWNMS